MRMPEEIEPGMFAPCGMNCAVCYKRLAPKKPCSGCLGSGNGKPAHCRACKIKACAINKRTAFCYDCPAFPCVPLKNLDKSYRARYGVSLLENSIYVKEHGVTAFMKAQKERYACTACGGIVSLHDNLCSECGARYE